ncbi:hypothetical protein H6F89_30400 [Cyanobacteria bacterium FACHB-63]|nr:hypothetical protein [Cyanobacteria bacterium FACHB-63]
MSFHRDDGTTIGGIALIASVVIAFGVGYWARDNGFKINIQLPEVEQGGMNR